MSILTRPRPIRVRGPHHWLRPMVARNPAQEHRVSTPLELLFDLCFAVAVSQAGSQLRHTLGAGHVGQGLVGYATVFFSIWWAWVNFTWFASTYDTDDALYRLSTLVQIAGVLVLAAGVPRAFTLHDFTTIVIGYAIMRCGLVAQWLRAAHSYPSGRRTALRYAAGVSCCWGGWAVLLLVLPGQCRLALWPVMAAAELGVPLWARRAGVSPWHPQHIAERFGLFTLIVLGESVLASTTAVQVAVDAPHPPLALYCIAAGGLLTLFSMWWLYFAKPAHGFLRSNKVGFVWGYGHLLVYAGAAAVGAGLGVNVDRVRGESHLSEFQANAAFCIPVAVFLLMVWVLHLRPHASGLAGNAVFPLAAVAIPCFALTGFAVLATGVLMALLVGAAVVVSFTPSDPD